MRISIELFLLDNLLMNYLLLRLASAVLGTRCLRGPLWCVSALGAVYALLSMTVWPVLSTIAAKLMLGGIMALPLAETPRTYPRALACLYFSACCMGGLMLGLVLLFGGNYRDGALVSTVPVRLALVAMCCCAILPRWILSLQRTLRHRALLVPLRIQLCDRSLVLTALADTGNLLTDPLSGLPVIIVRPGLLKDGQGRPVPYRTVDGGGVLYAIRPVGVWVYQGYWHRVDAMVAQSTVMLAAADAIIGAGVLTEERWCMHARVQKDAHANIRDASQTARGNAALRSFGGDTAAAVWPGGGAEVDRTPDA